MMPPRQLHTKFLSFQRFVFAPLGGIEGEEERRRIQMFLTLIGIQIILLCLATIQQLTMRQSPLPFILRFAIVGIIMILIYTRKRSIALSLMIVGLAVSLFVGLLLGNMFAIMNAVPAFLTVSILLTRRFQLMYALLLIAITVIVGAISPVHQGVILYEDLITLMVLGLLSVVVSMRIMDGDLHQIQTQIRFLQESEVRYRSLFEQSNAGVFILDFQTQRLQVNQRAADMLGYHMDEMTTLRYDDLIVEDDEDEKRTRRLMAGEILPPYECYFRRKDGTLLPTEISVEVVRDKDGRPLHRQSVARDISVRKSMELANQAFLEDIKALQDIQLELGKVDDLDTLYCHMIQLCHQRLGMERIGLFRLNDQGTQVRGTYGIDQVGQIRDESDYCEDITPTHWIHEILRAENHMGMWLEGNLYDQGVVIGGGWRIAAALWNGHQAIGYIISDNLLTGRLPRPYEAELVSILGSTFGHLIERKQMETALKRSEAQHIAHLGNWHWNPKSNVITWSNEIRRIFGVPQTLSQVTYEEFLAFIHPADRDQVHKIIQAAYENRVAYSLYYRVVHPRDGERTIHSMGRNVTNEQGETLYFIGTAQDITELKQAEDSLAIRNKYLTTLHDTTLHLLNRRDIDDLLMTLVNDATRILDAPYGEITLRQGDELVVRAFTDNQPFLKGDRVHRNQGVLSWMAVDSLQPSVVDDYMSWPHKRALYDGVALRAVANFPINVGQVCIGVLGVSRNTKNHPFSQEEILIGEMLSQLAALVLDNAHQYSEALRDIAERKQTEERLHALTHSLEAKSRIEHEQRVFADTLRDTASVISSTLDLDEILRLVLENIKRIIPHDTSSIMLVENRVAHIVQHNGWPSSSSAMTDLKLSIEETPHLNLMYQTQQSCIIADTSILDGWGNFDVHGVSRSYLAAPICVGEEVIGFLNLHSRADDYFTADQAHRLQAFVSHAAVALKNAQLYKQSQALAALEERQRLARDLHDSVTQTLFAASVTARAILKQWRYDSTSIGSDLVDLSDLTQGALAEMRTLLLELRPNALLESNLNDLLRQLSETIKGRARLKVHFDVEGQGTLPPPIKTAVFRIAQESLNNVIKHARAKTLTMRLRWDDGHVDLLIEDDGSGFDRDGLRPRHMGIAIMQERAAETGITLSIKTQPGQGTAVRAIWGIREGE